MDSSTEDKVEGREKRTLKCHCGLEARFVDGRGRGFCEWDVPRKDGKPLPEYRRVTP